MRGKAANWTNNEIQSKPSYFQLNYFHESKTRITPLARATFIKLNYVLHHQSLAWTWEICINNSLDTVIITSCSALPALFFASHVKRPASLDWRLSFSCFFSKTWIVYRKCDSDGRSYTQQTPVWKGVFFKCRHTEPRGKWSNANSVYRIKNVVVSTFSNFEWFRGKCLR